MKKIIQIKVIGDINSFNKSRKYNIDKYKQIKSRWEKKESSLIRLFPEVYEEICYTLKCLEDGYRIEFISGENELIGMIAAVGSAMGSPEIVHMRDNI